MKRKIKYIAALLLLLFVLLAGCAGQDDTITFSAEIEQVLENSILVETIEFKEFDKASVDLVEAEYDFELAPGQIVEVTIRSEIKESDPVQVSGVKLVLKGVAERKVSDYFPIQDNVKYVYEGMGNEFAGFTVTVDYSSVNKVQQRVDNGGTVIARVYEITDEELTRIFSMGEVYYRVNMLSQRDDAKEIMLMAPLVKGTTWTLEDGRQRTITGISTEVRTSLGTYPTIEVITEGSNGTTVDYYAKDIGLVKTIFRSGGVEVSSTLRTIEEDVDRPEMIRFYYPDMQADKIFYREKEVAFRTNDDTSKILEEAYKALAKENAGVVLSTDAAIKSLTLDEDTKVRLDLNKAFITDMNAGAGYESMILQSIANTFGSYYNSEEVVLTIEGEPYASGHIEMKEGESLPVKLDGITEKS